MGCSLLARVKIDSVTGEHSKVFLRLVLVEDTVTLNPNGDGYHMPLRREHHMVVRAFAHTKGLTMGLPLQVPKTVQYTFDVAGIQHRHLNYHRLGVHGVALKYIPKEWYTNGGPGFTKEQWYKDLQDAYDKFADEKDWRMNPNRLHVVVFIEDAHTGEILQAAMVPAESSGSKLQLP